ncbi:MAG: FMN-binding glutamate synthase family protein [Bacteriovorax sp.]|nr:FMN-binding glutamate synthase family protein [Bacteriovorax sp.]
MRKIFFSLLVLILLSIPIFAYFLPAGLWSLLITLPVAFIGLRDVFQDTQAIRKNFPVIGNFRYLFEEIRPEINQYFVESNTDGRPFSREQRSIVYQRAKKQIDSIPFGTQQNVYADGYEYLTHSIYPTHVDPKGLRVTIGSDLCTQPYSASIFNISAMSYGALSQSAVLALNGGAKDGGFAHNTGEGGLSPYHLKPGGDIIWQIGTGYFGCRDSDGHFDSELFKTNSSKEQVKMIELKISQGAKPGHGGILPAKKVSHEISLIRNVPMGKDVLSPPGHSAFHDPDSMMQFIQKLRFLSNGKPIGIKLCLGYHREFDDLVASMLKLKLYPDYIAVDGAEGGTGAAPLEFTNYMGTPGKDALIYVVNKLKAAGLKDKIKVVSTGKITTAFDVVRLLCLGADATYAARSMLLALGCIQALRCNTNQCPTGIATQDGALMKGLHVGSKRERVKNFHNETIKVVAEMLGAMGLKSHLELNRSHLIKRVLDSDLKSYADLNA